MTPEDVLIEGCIAGKAVCQRELYDRFARKMFNLCLRYTHRREEAEDAFQEGFISIFNSLKNFRRESSLETWITRIMMNSALRYVRKSKVEMIDVDDLYEIQYEEFDQALDKMNQEDVLKVIARLPDEHRTAFNMFVFEGYSHREIAQQMGIAENTSKSHVLRARKFIQEQIIKREKIELKNIL